MEIERDGRRRHVDPDMFVVLRRPDIVHRIETAFARIERLAARAARLLDRLDERLLAKAFRGELVPQDPAARLRTARADVPSARRGRKAKGAA